MIDPARAFRLVKLRTHFTQDFQFGESQLGIYPLFDLLSHGPTGEEEVFQTFVRPGVESHDSIIAKTVSDGHIAAIIIRVFHDRFKFLNAHPILGIIQLVASHQKFMDTLDLRQAIMMYNNLDIAVIQEILTTRIRLGSGIFFFQYLVLIEAFMFQVFFLHLDDLFKKFHDTLWTTCLNIGQIMPGFSQIRRVVIQKQHIDWAKGHFVDLVLELGTFTIPIYRGKHEIIPQTQILQFSSGWLKIVFRTDGVYNTTIGQVFHQLGVFIRHGHTPFGKRALPKRLIQVPNDEFYGFKIYHCIPFI